MKTFIKKTLLVFVSVTVIFLLADVVMSRLLRKSDILEFQAWNNIYNQKLINDLVIMGSSRAMVHFNPRIMDSVLHVDSYNLGYNASSVNRQVERYRTYCRVQNHEPDIIIYSIDYMSLGLTKDFEREQFYPYFFYDRLLMEQFDKYQNFSFMEKYLPFWRYCSCFFDFHFYEVLSDSTERIKLYKGFKNKDSKWDGTDLELIDKIKFIPNSETVEIFENYIHDVVSKGKKVIFVYSPAYCELTAKMENIEEMYAYFNGIAEKYSIPVLDYLHDEICNDTCNFYNVTHLNKAGADMFTLHVARDILEKELIKK